MPKCECDGSGFKRGGVRIYCGCKSVMQMMKMVSVDLSTEEAVIALERVFGPEWNRMDIAMMQPGFQRLRKAVTRER